MAHTPLAQTALARATRVAIRSRLGSAIDTRSNHFRWLAVCLAVCGLVVLSVSAQSPRMPLSEIRAGMVGEGSTVFTGLKREPFKAHILGVLENVTGPKHSLILARLEGGPLAQTGVIAGMSGSPVFIDGRLIGAVSYSLGAFQREPIAGITPIDEMTDLATPSTRPAVARVAFDLPLSHEGMARALRQAFASSSFAGRSDMVREVDGRGLAPMATSLRPIATPLGVAGLNSDALSILNSFFQDTGFVPVSVAAGAAPFPTTTEPLQGGDAVGVGLVSGDLALGATGTVTLVEGSQVFAFGHPFYNLGPTSFPMTRAWVHTVLPSLNSSVKLATLGDVIGTIQQDRSTAIGGTLGPGPSLIPVKVALESSRGQHRAFEFSVVDDQLFTPLLTYVSILSVLQSYEREAGAATFEIKGEARIKGHEPVALEDIFSGDQPSIPTAAYVATPLMALLRNDRTPVEIENVNLSIVASEQPRTATLERTWIDEVSVRAGRSVTLKMLTRSWRGDEQVRSLEIPIPSNARGPLSLLILDGNRLAQWEQREWRRASNAQSVNQLIRAFNTARRNNRLYVRLLDQAPGAVVEGEVMTSLPPSVMAVLAPDRDSARAGTLRQAVVGEWELPVGTAVVGSRSLTLNVDAN